MTGGPVMIAGRPYELGAAYRSGRPPCNRGKRPEAARRLLGYEPTFGWVGGRVLVARLECRNVRRETRLDMSGRAWAAWAREVAA